MGKTFARILVFGSSAAVLVLEILAGRMLAPYVGISLETFTGIIGTVLAGIAAGAWLGGVLADEHDPKTMIGPSLTIGGGLAWLSLPIVRALGPQLGDGPVAIILLTTAAFFLPSAMLTAVSPMVAKLRLNTLDETGAVVGGLSAAGTIGALAGTFLTGFVLVSAIPTRPIVLLLGGALVVSGAASHWSLTRAVPTATAVVVVLASGLIGAAANPGCQHETAYFCVNIVTDAANPSERSLYLDRLRHAFVDLDDPTNLDVRYIRLFAQISDGLPDGGLDTLHVGGGGFSFPRYLQQVRPNSTELVFEIDPDLVAIVEDELGLVQSTNLVVRTGDARLAIDDLVDDRFDLVIGDAFGSASVPWHLTTREFMTEVDRVLASDGMYVMNVIDADQSRFARAELATLAGIFEHVAVVLPPGPIPRTVGVNHVLIASHQPLPPIDIDPADGILLTEAETDTFIDGQSALRDDFAPVDQLQAG